MMVSPESYIAQFEDAPYSELIRARAKLVAELAELESYFELGSASKRSRTSPFPLLRTPATRWGLNTLQP